MFDLIGEFLKQPVVYIRTINMHPLYGYLLSWTDARRPVPRLWLRSAAVRVGVDVVGRMGTQQQQGYLLSSGEPGLVDRVLALYAGSRGLDFHRAHVRTIFPIQ